MPSRQTHLSLGFAMGCFHVILSLYLVKVHKVIYKSVFFAILSLGTLFLMLISISTIASILPDLIEPPISKYHRGFFHSQVMFIGANILNIMAVVVAVWTSELMAKVLFGLFAAMVSGYLSHLLLDYPLPRFTRKKPFYYLHRW